MADSDWKECLPFAGKWHTTPDGHRMHYVDEGAAHVPVVVVGGIVGWTYHFRNLIAALQEYGFRVIAVDNLGCGLSDKPKEYGYSLEGHIQNLSSLLDGTLKIPPFHLVAQGYGIATALGYASRNPGLVRKIVLLNAISPIDAPPAGALSCFIKSLLWEKSCLAVRRMPVRGTLFPLDPIVRRSLVAPYLHRASRSRLLDVISSLEGTPEAFERFAKRLSDTRMICIQGRKDKLLSKRRSVEYTKRLLPNTLTLTFPEAGHYLLEDLPEEVIPLIANFLF